MSLSRTQSLQKLAQHIVAIQRAHSLRVAIDGIDAAGKSTLAAELAPLPRNHGRPVIQASIDGFHNPQAVRYRQGVDSPDGYYHDSFNYAALIKHLLHPLGPDGNRHYRTAIFDYRTDSPVDLPVLHAPDDAILLFDGVFLQRPELRPYWDICLLVDVSFEVALTRGVKRDFNTSDRRQIQDRYRRRYIPGQKLYFVECSPRQAADIIWDNNDLHHPKLIIK